MSYFLVLNYMCLKKKLSLIKQIPHFIKCWTDLSKPMVFNVQCWKRFKLQAFIIGEITARVRDLGSKYKFCP